MDSSGGQAAAVGSSSADLAAQSASHDDKADDSSCSIVRLAPKTLFKSVNISEHSKLFVITTESHNVFRNLAVISYAAVAGMILGLVRETWP